jgi:hypothetical protein
MRMNQHATTSTSRTNNAQIARAQRAKQHATARGTAHATGGEELLDVLFKLYKYHINKKYLSQY